MLCRLDREAELWPPLARVDLATTRSQAKR